ncbi:MAG: 2Fe-2S iron-sulfur cluster binding domain-containing protein [Micavibrio sp.]|nr:2Fe-2S iron-sulfur cluster binding domain-containing protein [Micavibrio sp.]
MPTITFIYPDGHEVEVEAEENSSIQQAAEKADIKELPGVCGGSMACATCHIKIPEEWKVHVEAEDNEFSDEENDMLDTAFNVDECSRLGCQVKITSALTGLRVIIP